MPDKRYAPDGNGNLIRITKENADGSFEFIARPENGEGQERLHVGVGSNGKIEWWAETDKDGEKVGGNRSSEKFAINTAVQIALGLMRD
ncbi:hypothetical protein [Kamptonema formosum]|uniref:hypothetical protein n=1 Tax=Kamptonema formosum TaxID=331992 RepID=UPI0003493671|nr:hypothetical protein [Oscillatoria sp. PCC 10802]